MLASSVALGPQARAASDDNAQINALYQQFTTAFRNKDVDAVMSVYVAGPSLFVFDVGTPREHVGSDSYRADWKSLFASLKGPTISSFEITELAVVISGNVAYSHSIQHFSGTTPNGKPLAPVSYTHLDVYKRQPYWWAKSGMAPAAIGLPTRSAAQRTAGHLSMPHKILR